MRVSAQGNVPAALPSGKRPSAHFTGGWVGPDGEYRCTFTLSLTSALDESECSRPRSDRFTPVKETQCPFYRRLGGPQGRSECVGKMLPPPGFDPRTVHTVASRHKSCLSCTYVSIV
jgi:hypothetical protein